MFCHHREQEDKLVELRSAEYGRIITLLLFSSNGELVQQLSGDVWFMREMQVNTKES